MVGALGFEASDPIEQFSGKSARRIEYRGKAYSGALINFNTSSSFHTTCAKSSYIFSRIYLRFRVAGQLRAICEKIEGKAQSHFDANVRHHLNATYRKNVMLKCYVLFNDARNYRAHLNAIDLARNRTRNLGHRRPALYQLANQVDATYPDRWIGKGGAWSMTTTVTKSYTS
ncbi:hypothetical protein ANN_03448 [Periplaneta americana]|uniref:Uncharacterized protein n=1 Tax=Periplaneta americana TaxID=6978 RepID=A0ABQ8TZ02_PERAM|nr:hypothetical protein ANN_03448 [Periplaneta americana]